MTSHLNFIKHLEKSLIEPSETLPKNCRGGSTPKLSILVHHHPDIKIIQKHYIKKKIIDQYH